MHCSCKGPMNRAYSAVQSRERGFNSPTRLNDHPSVEAISGHSAESEIVQVSTKDQRGPIKGTLLKPRTPGGSWS